MYLRFPTFSGRKHLVHTDVQGDDAGDDNMDMFQNVAIA
jgi:hypothetical protein